MTSVVLTSVGERKGTPRIWVEGIKLALGGFKIGVNYEVREQSKGKIVLARSRAGGRVVSIRKKNGKEYPIIDLNNLSLADCFELGQKLRLVIRRGVVVIRAHAQAGKVADRVTRLLKKLRENQALETGSLFHGGGILDSALHSGFASAGSNSFVKLAVERNREFLDYSLDVNRHMFTGESIFIEAPIQDLTVDGAPQLDILCAGIPCTGASSSGKAKNGIKHAEEHVEAGSMFYYFVRWVEATNPAICIIENVPNYQSTASMAAIRAVLTSMGYSLQERILEGNEFGALEARKRLCVVAVSNGLEDVFDLEAVTPLRQKPATVGELMEDIAPDSERWAAMTYLADKEKSDKAAGKGFRRQLYDGTESSINTITADYMKRRSTDPMIKHPTDPDLCRLATCLEHARFKGIPEHMAEQKPGAPAPTNLHKIFGQSVIYPVFEAVGFHLAKAFQAYAANDAVYESAGKFAERTTYVLAA